MHIVFTKLQKHRQETEKAYVSFNIHEDMKTNKSKKQNKQKSHSGKSKQFGLKLLF